MGAKKIKNDLSFMTLTEVAEKLSYCRKTIERFAREGSLKTVKINGKRLVLESDFITFVKASLTEGDLDF